MRKGRTHQPKTKSEVESFVHAIRGVKDDPTVEVEDIIGSTLHDQEATTVEYNPKSRKTPTNRIRLHVKENWLNYIFAFLAFVAGSFLFTVKMDLTRVNSDITHLSGDIVKTAAQVEKLSDNVSTIHSEVKSLNDRFQLFMDLFSRSLSRD
jgi:hypothetical protein